MQKQTIYIHFYQLEVFAIKAAEKLVKKIIRKCDIFHNFKNIPCYDVTIEESLKKFYFPLFDDGLTLIKTLKLAYICF